jgi:hypothetical protein
MDKLKACLIREWRMLSTKFGTILLAVSTVAPQFAQFDVRFAYAGAAAGFLLILWRGQNNGN